MTELTEANRRNVLKTVGAGILGSATVTGSASAREDGDESGRQSAYGNGNGIGAFLNEKAQFKDDPVWSSGIADMTGQSEVEIVVGALTSVDIPIPTVPEELPVAFAPKAVSVSPGTDVTWTWGPGIHHSVTSLEGTGESFEAHGEPGDTFAHTFEELGNFLYYCHPHGTPYTIDLGPPVGEVDNLFGMRGAVNVTDE